MGLADVRCSWEPEDTHTHTRTEVENTSPAPSPDSDVLLLEKKSGVQRPEGETGRPGRSPNPARPRVSLSEDL